MVVILCVVGPISYNDLNPLVMRINFIMNLYSKWMALPFKARMYIGGSTFVAALAGDYITGKLNEEVSARKEAEAEIGK